MISQSFFDGFFSPRVSIGYTLGENSNHNIRASFQTGFRNPTTQDLYIGLDVGRAILVGGATDNPARDIRTYDVSGAGQAIVGSPTIVKDGTGAYENSFLASSVTAFAASGNPADLEVANSSLVDPEQVTSYEVGYRGKIANKVVIDLSAYYNEYQDFLSNETVISPFYGTVGDNALSIAAIANGDWQAYQTYTNTDAEVSSYGGAIGITGKLGKFDIGANYTYAKLEFDQEANPDFRTSFNTPEHKFKATLGSTNLLDNIGFNVAWRWSDEYFWEASFGDGVIPSYHTLDAQVNFRIPKLKSVLKFGGTNLLGDEYFTAFGTGFIGSQYYVSLTINN